MSQFDLFGNSAGSASQSGPPDRIVKIANGEYRFLPEFYTMVESDRYFRVLMEQAEWKQESMKMYGKTILFPRLTAWYGETDKPYSFSGITLQPLPWLPELLEIRDRLQALTKTSFNSVLLNLYRSGNDSISWHTDAEPELGKDPVIGSVNFGATRTFQLRHKYTKEKIDIDLTHGSALIMQGQLQHFWQHQLPKTSKPVNDRINLTFRYIKNT
ncbi:alpha-ketoglutarate-dependent dioxygenase AlkB [Mucilaginibacter sp. 21P]|uniref:alpha-ketoglutarate-dependent dioxygenase AlkB family protein n=1 Tax=Mucilaginibacter sp. 21P TaxID=2778902 RepID=UPI001C58DC9A|nr:alpha-ketoglutarate-dependent dioxygenase AlkB [Mucilaginibacter sp. 21P]QXV63994.1 alpha-ketoglutarate-dependent dioxygenase AlkB [Mucilaginibacter sp. 21P]